MAQTVDVQRQLYDLIADANSVLEPSLGLHLDTDATQPWSLDADDTLESALEALRHDDPGDGVDVVVGLIGALPRPTESLHEVGYAEVLGKYVILRASSRLGEHDAFDRALADLSDDVRDRVVRARRRHRAEAVFLHELGHTLGALHEADVASIMHPAYDEKMSGFSEADRALFLRALQSFRGRNTAGAYATARPLFGAYPDSYAVQDLRCQLATVRWLEESVMLAECAPSLRLADAGAR